MGLAWLAGPANVFHREGGYLTIMAILLVVVFGINIADDTLGLLSNRPRVEFRPQMLRVRGRVGEL